MRIAIAAALAALVVSAAAASPKRTLVTFTPLETGVSGAVYVAQAPGLPNALYVVRQGGRIEAIVNGKRRATPFADLTKKTAAGGERGLLSMAFHPNYRRNHLVYVDYTDVNGDSRIVQYRTDGSKILPKTARQLLFVKQPYANHNGGQLQFGPDGRLWTGFGDGGSAGDPENRSQNLGTRLGKLLALDVNKRGAKWQIVGYGLRNPWRFSFDRANGGLWIGDVGQNEWEEIDWLPAPVRGVFNFGWPTYEGKARYSDRPLKGSSKLIGPVHVYQHGDDGCSVTGGYLYRGKAIPGLVGRYVFGDFCSGIIWSGVLNGGQLADVRSEGKVGELAGFGQDNAGELYAASLGGTVYKLG